MRTKGNTSPNDNNCANLYRASLRGRRAPCSVLPPHPHLRPSHLCDSAAAVPDPPFPEAGVACPGSSSDTGLLSTTGVWRTLPGADPLPPWWQLNQMTGVLPSLPWNPPQTSPEGGGHCPPLHVSCPEGEPTHTVPSPVLSASWSSQLSCYSGGCQAPSST